MAGIQTELLYRMSVTLDAPIDLQGGPLGRRIIMAVSGGSFEGPKMKGEVLGRSGADWALLRSDNVLEVDVRVCLRTHDGADIFASYQGRVAAADPPSLFKALDRSKPADPADADRYYFRTAPFFETGSPNYTWLNKIVAVGKGYAGGGAINYEVYTVK